MPSRGGILFPPDLAGHDMTLDDLLQMLPGLTRQRSLNAAWLRILLDRQRKECTWCGQQVAKGRSTWCSDECVRAFNLRCSTSHQAAFVIKRDKGICQICGRDTVESENQFDEAWKTERKNYGPYFKDYGPAELKLKEQFGYGRGRWSEVDHKKPVCEGGGLCSVENLRLICGACHADETRKLAASRSAKTKGS